jgi:hypothetical protein
MAATHPGWSLASKKARPPSCLSSGLVKKRGNMDSRNKSTKELPKKGRPSLSDVHVWLTDYYFRSTRN